MDARAVRDRLPTSEGLSTARADVPKAHALDRLEVGFDLKSVATEYALLRRCILSLYQGARARW